MSDATYDRMAASLGSLLLLWARVEHATHEAVARRMGGPPPPESVHGIAAALRTWEGIVSDQTGIASLNPLLARTLCDRLQRPRHIRNGVCHGLIGIASAYGNGPGRLMWKLNGVEESIDWEALQNMFGWLSKVPAAIAMISDPPGPNQWDRRLDTAENRDWWRNEFALPLP